MLKRAGIYHRLKASSLYGVYWRIADKSLVEAGRKEVSFYRNLLEGFRPGDLIFDIGANHGAKTSVFLELGARVVSIEPDESNQEILKEKFLKYRIVRKPVAIVGKAVSDTCSIQTMLIDEPGSAKNTFSQKWAETLRVDEKRFGHKLDFAQEKQVETTTVEQLVAAHGRPFFVKIDVEGYEVNVLRGMKHPVPYLSFEVNLPEFEAEGLECVQLLGRLAADGKFNYAVDCQQGLVLQRWLSAQEFSGVLDERTEESIEVFWKTSLPTSR